MQGLARLWILPKDKGNGHMAGYEDFFRIGVKRERLSSFYNTEKGRFSLLSLPRTVHLKRFRYQRRPGIVIQK